MDSKELNSFLFVQLPQIGSAYVTEGKLILKYRSKSEFLGKKRLRLIEFVNEPSLSICVLFTQACCQWLQLSA